jgi:hypothetical protein
MIAGRPRCRGRGPVWAVGTPVSAVDTLLPPPPLIPLLFGPARGVLLVASGLQVNGRWGLKPRDGVKRG